MHSPLRSRSSLAMGTVLAVALASLAPAAAMAQEPQSGGTLLVAADTERANLNPAMVASS